MKKTSSKSKATRNKFLLIPEFKGNIKDLKISDAKYYYILGNDDTLYYVDVGSKICSNLCKINDVENLKESLNLGSKESKVLENEDLGLLKEFMVGMEVLAAVTKPDVQYVWGAGGSLVDPGAVKIDLGWLSAEKPPFQFFNFWQNKVDNYIAHNNQFGINRWDAITEYQIGSAVLASDNIHYISNAINTNANPISNPSVWSRAFIPESLAQKESRYYNFIINGGFRIAQRGSSNSFSGLASGYAADRWLWDQSAGETTINRFDIIPPSVSPYPQPGQLTGGLNISRTVAGSVCVLSQKIENVVNLSGSKNSLVMSIPSNSHDPSTTVLIEVVQNFGTGGSPSAPFNTVVGTLDLNSSYAPQFFIFDLPSIQGKVLGTNQGTSYIQLKLTFSDNLYNLDPLGISYTMSPIRHNYIPRNFQEELALCQRYYEKSYPINIVPGSNETLNLFTTQESGNNNSTYIVKRTIQFKNTKFKTPTVLTYSEIGTPGFVDVESGQVIPVLQNIGDSSFAVLATNVGNSTFRDLAFHWTAESEI